MTEGQSADERLVIMLEARISEYEKKMKQAERQGTRTYNSLRTNSRGATRQMERDMVAASARINSALGSVSEAIGDFAMGFGVGALALGVSQFAGAARNAVAAMADLGAEAKRAGVDVEEFQRWRYVAEQNRIGIDSLTDGFKELSLRADEFIITGAGAGKEAFERLGFSAEELAAALKDPSALFLDIIGRLEQFDRAAQIRIADEIFGGTGGEKFVQLLDQGAAKIGETKAQADALGVVIDQDLVAKAEKLDRKFNQWGASIAASFQVATINAAQMFGIIENHQATMAFDAEIAARVIGNEIAAQLSKLPEVTEGARAEIESLIIEYQQLGDEAQRLVPALSDASNVMRGLGNSGAADDLSRLAMEVQEASNSFENGTITGDQFRLKLTDVLKQIELTVSGFDELDRARLDGVTGAVSGLFDWISQIPASISAATSAILDSDLSSSVAAPVVGDYRTGYGNAYTPAPPSAPAPRAAPARGGGGGGGNARLDALLRDLQTEKEAVTAWHNESLALLQSATDAQLAAYGGRHGAIERLEAEHAARMGALQQAGGAGTLANAQNLFGALATVTAGGNDRLLRVHQKFAAAEALINTYRAQAQVLANPSLNFWAKLPAMAAIGAAGMGLVRALRGSGSAGAVPSAMPNAGGASEGASPVGGSAGSNTAPPLRFMVQGLDPAHLYTGQALIDLVSNIQAELGNRGLVMEFNR